MREEMLLLQMQEQQRLRQRLVEQEMFHQQQRLLVAEQRRREGIQMELLALQAGAGGGYGYGASASGPFAAYSPYISAGASPSASAHLAITRASAYTGTEAPFLAATGTYMPPLVSLVSPERATAAEVAVPEQQEKKRKMHTCSAETATAPGKKKSKQAKSQRELPKGVNKRWKGKYQYQGKYQYEARIYRGKSFLIGTFDTPEQASAAYMSVQKDLDDANLSSYGVDEVDAIFEAAQKKAVEAVGGFIPKKTDKATPERDLPKGIQKLKSGKFQAKIYWGGKERHIGTFDNVGQASAAYVSAREDLDNTNLSACDDDTVIALFDAAQKKAIEAVGGTMPRKQKPRGTNISSGVRKTPSGEFEVIIRWGGKHWYVGIFDAPEQASIAYASVERDLFRVIPLPPSKPADVAHATFDAAKKKALETVQVMIESRNMYGRMF